MDLKNIIGELILHLQSYLNSLETAMVINLKIQLFSDFLFQYGKFISYINIITKIERNKEIEHIQLKDHEFEDISNLNETLNNFCIKNKLIYSQILSKNKNGICFEFNHKSYNNYYEKGNIVNLIIAENLKYSQTKILDFKFYKKEKHNDFWDSENLNKIPSECFTIVFSSNLENLEDVLAYIDEFKKKKEVKNIPDKFYRYILLINTNLAEDYFERYRGIDFNDFHINFYGNFKKKSYKADLMKDILSFELNESNNIQHEDSEFEYKKIKEKYQFINNLIQESFEIFFCDRRHYLNEKYNNFREGYCYLISDCCKIIKKFCVLHKTVTEIKAQIEKNFKFENETSVINYSEISQNSLINFIHIYINFIQNLQFDTRSEFRNEKSFVEINCEFDIKITKKEFLAYKKLPISISYMIHRKFNYILEKLKSFLKPLDFDLNTSGLNYNKNSEEIKKFIENINRYFINEEHKNKLEYLIEKKQIINNEKGVYSVYNLLFFLDEEMLKLIENFNIENYFFREIKFLPQNDSINKIPLRNNYYKTNSIINSSMQKELIEFLLKTCHSVYNINILKYSFSIENLLQTEMIKIKTLFLEPANFKNFNRFIESFNLQENILDNHITKFEQHTVTKNKKMICKKCSILLKHDFSFFYCKICFKFYCENCPYESLSKEEEPHNLLYILTDNNYIGHKIFFKLEKNISSQTFQSYNKDKIILICNFCQEELQAERYVLLNEIVGHQNDSSDFCIQCLSKKAVKSKILKEINSENEKDLAIPGVFLRIIYT